MGIRVGFYFGGPDGLLSAFLDSPLDKFQHWLVEVFAEFPEDVSPSTINLVQEVQRSGVLALTRATEADYKKVDRLIEDWLLFIDISHIYDLVSVSKSCVNVRYYKKLREVFEMRGVINVARLLGVTIEGRPILRDEVTQPFYSDDEVLRVGYWTLEEAKLLQDVIQELEQEDWLKRVREDGVLGIVEEVVHGAVRRGTGVIFVVC